MALRNPVYLDLDTLIAQADYHDIELRRLQNIMIVVGGWNRRLVG